MLVLNNVLLFGLPRAGTTWVDKVFDSSPTTMCFHEPDSKVAQLKLPLLFNGKAEAGYKNIVDTYLKALPEITNLQVVSKNRWKPGVDAEIRGQFLS